MELYAIIAISFVLGEIVGVVLIVALQGSDRLRSRGANEPLPFPWPPKVDVPAASDGAEEYSLPENLEHYEIPAFLRRQAE